MQQLGSVKGKMRIVLPLVSILLFSLTVSCVLPIPLKFGTRGTITKRALEFLEEGVTSREQVLLHLGEPDFVGENEQIFVWDWVQAWDLFLAGAAGGGGGAGVFPIRRKCSGLLIKFNDQAGVQAVERWSEGMADDEACRLGGPLSHSTNEYTNYVHGFSIQFPPEWEVPRSSLSLGELDVSELPKEWGVKNGAEIINVTHADFGGFRDLFSGKVALLSIAIGAYPIARELEVWEVRPERIGNILGPTALKAIRIVDLVGSGRTRTVDGSHAIWMKQEIEKQDSGLAGVVLTYSSVHHRKLFQISGYWPKNSDESQAQKFEQKIERAIWSFRFIR